MDIVGLLELLRMAEFCITHVGLLSPSFVKDLVLRKKTSKLLIVDVHGQIKIRVLKEL